jgi:hypothetical protein
MATGHHDWSQWRDDQGADTVNMSDPIYYTNDTVDSSASL